MLDSTAARIRGGRACRAIGTLRLIVTHRVVAQNRRGARWSCQVAAVSKDRFLRELVPGRNMPH